MLFTGLALNIIMLLFLNWIYFFDWLQVIGWILSLITPNKKAKEIEDNRSLRQKEEFKRHQNKWKLWFLIVPASFAVVYLLLSYLTQQLLVSYFCSIIIVIVEYGILERYESKERENVSK